MSLFTIVLLGDVARLTLHACDRRITKSIHGRCIPPQAGGVPLGIGRQRYGSERSEDPDNIRAKTFKVTMPPYIDVTEGQTDGRTDGRATSGGNTALCTMCIWYRDDPDCHQLSLLVVHWCPTIQAVFSEVSLSLSLSLSLPAQFQSFIHSRSHTSCARFRKPQTSN